MKYLPQRNLLLCAFRSSQFDCLLWRKAPWHRTLPGKESIDFLCSGAIWHPCSLCAPLKLRWLLPPVPLPQLLWRLLLAPRLEWCLLLPPVVHLPGKQVLFIIWVIWIPLLPVNSVGFLGWELEQSCWNTEMRAGWFSEKQSRRCGVDKFVSFTRLFF